MRLPPSFQPGFGSCGRQKARGAILPQRRRWVLLRRSSIRSKSSNRSKRLERLKRLERFEPRLSAPGFHLASGIFDLTAESGFNDSRLGRTSDKRLANQPRTRQRHIDRDHAQRAGDAHRRRGPWRADER
jgi:hypothetical protein